MMVTLGALLRELRRTRGLSQERLAGLSQLTARTLRYWEADRQQPRTVELESVLTALGATFGERARVYALLTDQRSVRLAPAMSLPHNVPASLLGPLPGIGDLLRAMRLRRNWTQEQAADEMRVSRATVMRWEATQTLPSNDAIHRLCIVLRASPEERSALQARRLAPASWTPRLSLDECIAQYESLMQLRGGDGSIAPLADLHTLALKRHLHFLLGEAPEALKVLANVEIFHGWWLFMQGREVEACTANWRALNLLRGRFAPEDFWTRALNLLSANAASSARGPENAVQLLYPWLRLIPASLHLVLLCDMALYAGQAGREEEAAHYLDRVRRLLPVGPTETPEEHWHFRYVRLTTARVFLSGGKPIEAMEWLPAASSAGDGDPRRSLP